MLSGGSGLDQLYAGNGNDMLVFDKHDVENSDGSTVHFSGGSGVDFLSVGDDGANQIIDMTKTAYQELEGAIINASDAELSLALDKTLQNDTADVSNTSFVCTGAMNISLDGFNWQMSENTANLSTDLENIYQDREIDTTSLTGYTFTNDSDQSITIWSDTDLENISLNGTDLG